MATYRCLGCRSYRHRPEHQRIGLGSVCSPECATAVRTLQRPAKPSSRPDVSPHTRDQVSERDGRCCRFCGTTDSPHQHHISYRSEGVDHSPNNLITLCAIHHATVHGDKRRWQPVCRAYVSEVLAGRARFLPEIDREINA